jgi:hypothetical protein
MADDERPSENEKERRSDYESDGQDQDLTGHACQSAQCGHDTLPEF